MKTQILRILRNSPDYVSGQELCEELGVSRTAVWKSMNKLKEEGYEIEAVQNRGYHLISCPDVVTGSEVGSRLSTSWAGRKILHYKETDSTNNQAKREAEAAEHGTLIIADTECRQRKKGKELVLSCWDRDIYELDSQASASASICIYVDVGRCAQHS